MSYAYGLGSKGLTFDRMNIRAGLFGVVSDQRTGLKPIRQIRQKRPGRHLRVFRQHPTCKKRH